jgi:uncharacterized protein with HEPN domain
MPSSEVNARDREALNELLAQAQLVIAMGLYPRAQFMSHPKDQRAVAERLRLMASSAGRLSRGFREGHPEVPWDDLLEAGRIAEGGVAPEELDRLWRTLKRTAPRIVRAVAPLVEGERPELAFALASPEPQRRKRTAAAGGEKAKTRRRGKSS